MSKNPNKKAVQKDEPMNGAMKFFLAGCVAELYLLILRRFYVNAGSDVARFAWYDHYLWILAGIGAGVMRYVPSAHWLCGKTRNGGRHCGPLRQPVSLWALLRCWYG